MKRLVVAMTGASGAQLGVHLLHTLRATTDIEIHLILSKWARATIELETPHSVGAVTALADVVHSANDQAASISSGSFHTDGMVIIPCSMRTLAAVRTGYSDGLIARAADVTLKERRRLVLVPREAPLSEIHLDNMLALARMGAVIMPPMPAFYNRPETIDDIIKHISNRVLDQLGIPAPDASRWEGIGTARAGGPTRNSHTDTAADPAGAS